MFCEDSLEDYFLGTQKGNKLTITGYEWSKGVSGLEFLFCNFPEQLTGETIHVSSFHGDYDDEIRVTADSWFNRPYEYIDIPEISKLTITDSVGLTTQFIQSLKQGVEYKITLSWYGYSANYYVEFAIDPATIIPGTSHHP